MNKFIVVILSVLLCSLNSYSQELVVKSFMLNEGDLSARTEKRLDANGNQCALIKVESIPVCEFGGYVIGNVEKKLGAYWVYVCAKNPITKKIIVSSDNFQPLEVEFNKYGISNIEGGLTYTLRVESINYSAINIVDGHKYIDLGLSVNWAECNLGALRVNEKGNKYTWGINFASGDTVPQEINNICGTKYDAVSQLWGGEWRMPTEKELSELLYECIVYDDKENGIMGKRIIGKTGNSIFIPYDYKNENGESSNELYGINIWSGDKRMILRPVSMFLSLPDGYYPAYVRLTQSSYKFTSRKGVQQHSIRPVINSKANVGIDHNWGMPTNGRYLVKGQLVYAGSGNKPIGNRAVNIYDNVSGKIIQQIINENGLFEIWVSKNQELRFELDDNPDQEPVIMKAQPILKVHLMVVPKFGLG